MLGGSAAWVASAVVPLGVGGSTARSGAARFSSSFSSMLGLGPWILHGRLGRT